MSQGKSVEDVVGLFIAHKRALGRKYNSAETELRLLVRFCAEQGVVGIGELTPTLLDEFLGSRPRSRPRGFNHLLGVVRCMLEWAVAQQLIDTSPLRARRRRVTSQPIPFIFDQEQVRRLLQAAGALPDRSHAPDRGATYRAIFALCYGLGLRVGEACGLRLDDIDADHRVLVVRGGKFGKSRLVPHGPRIGELLDEQLDHRRRAGALEDHPHCASRAFHELVLTLDLPVPAGVSPPRLHCLRHSFAVGCLLRWYREGLDPAARLQQLSTFMGHVDPSSTQVYLTITPALLEEANQRFEAFAAPAWTEAAR
jgi:integrase